MCINDIQELEEFLYDGMSKEILYLFAYKYNFQVSRDGDTFYCSLPELDWSKVIRIKEE